MASTKWSPFCLDLNVWTHWGRMMHVYLSKLTIIGSDNGLSPGRRQAIIWTNGGILLIWTLGTNFFSEIHTFSFKKMHRKMLSGKWRPFCLGLNVLRIVNPEGHLIYTTWLICIDQTIKPFFINLLRAKFFKGNKNIYLPFMSFLHIDMMQVVEILPQVRQELNLLYIVNIMGADVLATQGAKASATMIFTMLNQINSVPARKGLTTEYQYIKHM